MEFLGRCDAKGMIRFRERSDARVEKLLCCRCEAVRATKKPMKPQAGTFRLLLAALLVPLLTGCAALYQVGLRPPDRFGGPQAGERAPEFTLKTTEGRSVSLRQLRAQKPVALITGSYSCPAFRGWAKGLREVHAHYRDRVAFLILYTIEAHPKGSPSPYRPGREWLTSYNRREGILIAQPRNYKERVKLATRARDVLELDVPIAVDQLDNAVWKAYGAAPNAAYLIATDGKVVIRHGWFHPPTFERSIVRHLSRGGETDFSGLSYFSTKTNLPL